MNYHFRVHRNNDGLWAECIELSGCLTQADSEKELEANMKEVLNLFIDEPSDSKIIFPLPKKKVSGRNIVLVPVDPKIAFAFAMRRERLRNKLTQAQAAARLGITGSLNKYQRLERSQTANPEFLTLVKIRKAFPRFPIVELTS